MEHLKKGESSHHFQCLQSSLPMVRIPPGVYPGSLVGIQTAHMNARTAHRLKEPPRQFMDPLVLPRL